MVGIRRATFDDLIHMQQTNLMWLPENYQYKYYLYSGISWPHLNYCAVTDTGRIVGYVISKLDEENEKDEEKPQLGQITSISVHRDYRKLGIAKRLMEVWLAEMQEMYDVTYWSLNVRVSNVGAISLYKDVLGFKIHHEDEEYYADNENAYEMRKYYNPEFEEKDMAEANTKTKGKKQNDEGDISNILATTTDDASNTQAESESDSTKPLDKEGPQNTKNEEEKVGENDGEREDDGKKKKKRKKKRR